VARDAARGVGGVEEGGNELTVRGAVLSALKLPRCKASDVDMELVQSGVVTIAGELDLELQLILRDGLAAHRAYVSARSWALQLRCSGRFACFFVTYHLPAIRPPSVLRPLAKSRKLPGSGTDTGPGASGPAFGPATCPTYSPAPPPAPPPRFP
jgi:hypothetical protein